MKKNFLFINRSLKKFFSAKELRILTVLLLREALALALFSLVAILSLESILPGTVSLRESTLFFILGIALSLSLEQTFAKTIPIIQETSAPKNERANKRARFLFVGFFLWATILFGNSLLGFHPVIVVGTLFAMLGLLWTFFGITFKKTADS